VEKREEKNRTANEKMAVAMECAILKLVRDLQQNTP
jgi:hypothetical protein